jgi:hypothetical protein
MSNINLAKIKITLTNKIWLDLFSPYLFFIFLVTHDIFQHDVLMYSKYVGTWLMIAWILLFYFSHSHYISTSGENMCIWNNHHDNHLDLVHVNEFVQNYYCYILLHSLHGMEQNQFEYFIQQLVIFSTTRR